MTTQKNWEDATTIKWVEVSKDINTTMVELLNYDTIAMDTHSHDRSQRGERSRKKEKKKKIWKTWRLNVCIYFYTIQRLCNDVKKQKAVIIFQTLIT